MRFRVLLIYPPMSQSEPLAGNPVGLDVDRPFMPYGVMTIAASLRDRGFEVDVVNLCTSDWRQALSAIESRPADLFGISCYTFHRHAAAALGAAITPIAPATEMVASTQKAIASAFTGSPP